MKDKPKTCENPEADCYREPTTLTTWVEDHGGPEWKEFEKYMCTQCSKIMRLGYGASSEPFLVNYGDEDGREQ